jgi:hypothetical protein
MKRRVYASISPIFFAVAFYASSMATRERLTRIEVKIDSMLPLCAEQRL